MNHSVFTSQLQILTKVTSIRVPTYGKQLLNGTVLIICLEILQILAKWDEKRNCNSDHTSSLILKYNKNS